ncbi:pancreatic progenitor cell differentiation and proliferation factor-like [Mustela lutreola]|uniref:pancreatic progenitor cell differentiation and proliferation factor-like n=1 Tax=Mustela lutreola TaxID=9666 RepID=UPI002796F4F6|nr:pancreatic progenitor cell differentiation and proliferation factor-like [Mustela lutreola]
MAAIPSSSWLVATHQYDQRCLGSTSSNTKCRVSWGSCPSPPQAPHGPLGPLSHSWLQCWSPQNTRSPLRPPAS